MRDTDISDLETMTFGKVEKSVVFVSIDGSKNIFGSCLGFNLEFETSIFGCFSGKVDIVNFIKSNVNWRLRTRLALSNLEIQTLPCEDT